MSRVRVFPGVLLRVVRLVPWWHLGLGLVAAFALAAPRRIGPWTTPDDAVFGLRVAAVAFAASTAFLFDDPAVSLTEGKPVPRWLQRTARLVLAVPAVAAGWWLLVSWMEAGLEEGFAPAASVPRLGMWVEMATMLGAVWAVATVVNHTGGDGGGIVATPALLAFVVVLTMLPERWAMFPSPAEPPLAAGVASPQWELWIDAHRRWAAVGCLAWAGVVVGLTSWPRTWLAWRMVRPARVAGNGGHE